MNPFTRESKREEVREKKGQIGLLMVATKLGPYCTHHHLGAFCFARRLNPVGSYTHSKRIQRKRQTPNTLIDSMTEYGTNGKLKPNTQKDTAKPGQGKSLTLFSGPSGPQLACSHPLLNQTKFTLSSHHQGPENTHTHLAILMLGILRVVVVIRVLVSPCLFT